MNYASKCFNSLSVNVSSQLQLFYPFYTEDAGAHGENGKS